MNKETELAKNTLILGIGKLGAQIVSFLLLPLYTAVLSTQEYGTVDLILSYVQLLFPIVGLQLEQSLFRFLVTNRTDKQVCKKTISTLATFFLLHIFVFIVLFLAVQSFVPSIYKWFFLINTILALFSSFTAGCLRGLGYNAAYSVQGFISVIATVLLNILFLVVFKWGVSGMLLASGLAAMISGVYSMLVAKLYQFLSVHNVEPHRMKEYYAYSVPLVPNQLSWWMMKASDKTIVTTFLSVAANGIIAVASKFSSAYILVYNIFNLAWAESVVLHIDDSDGQAYISKMINKMFALFAAISFGIVACMPVAFPLLVDGDYGAAYDLVPIYMLSALLNAVTGLYSALYIARNDTKAVAITSGLAAAIGIIVNVSLISFIGVFAAPISAVVAFGVITVYRYFHSRKYLTVKINGKLLLTTAFVGTSVIMLYFVKNVFTSVISFIICIVYAIVANRSLLREVIQSITLKLRNNCK